MIRIFIIFSFLFLFSNQAYAGLCPILWGKIDKKLDSINDENLIKQVKQLRIDGEKAHSDGDHSKSENLLNKALNLIEN